MNVDEFNAFCGALPHAHHVVQWGGAHVWKVADKVFAIGGWNEGTKLSVSFKCSDVGFEVLKDQAGLRPAPYLASRGLTWIQRTTCESMTDAALKDHLRESHRLVSLGLTKKLQLQLGLNGDSQRASPARARRASTKRTSTSRGQQ